MVTGKSFDVTVSCDLSRNVRCLSRGKIIWSTETDNGASQEKFFNWWRLYFNLALLAFLATRFVPLDFRHLLVVGMLSFFLETTTFSFCCFLQTAMPGTWSSRLMYSTNAGSVCCSTHFDRNRELSFSKIAPHFSKS